MWRSSFSICRPQTAAGLLFTVVIAAEAIAQPSSARSVEACGCVSQLDELAAATRSNYAGYHDKASTPADSAALERHLALLRNRAARTMGSQCIDLLKAYIRFFRDHHIQVRSAAAITDAGASHRPPRVDLDAPSLAIPASGDPILGTWESTSSRTRLRIVPAPVPYDRTDRYAILLAGADTAWSAGDVYATFVFDSDDGVYHAAWYSPTRPTQEWSAVVVDDSLLFTGFSAWHRVLNDQAATSGARRDPLQPSFRGLGPGAALLSLPSMQVQYAAHVDSVVRTNAAAIAGLDLLVIDVRGNQGGGDNTYMPILPLLYTDTIVTVAGTVLSSPANIAYYERFLDPTGENSPAWVVDMLAQMRANPGAHIALPPSTIAYDSVHRRPRDVAILMDGVAASSTETFLLKARQSSKVRLFGQPSAGIVDYLNPAQHEMSCGIVLQSPTIRRSARLPVDAIDNSGIAPDVVLPWTESDPVTAILGSYGLKSGRRDRQQPVRNR